MSYYKPGKDKIANWGKTYLGDFQGGNVPGSIRKDFKELKEFYLDEDQRKRGWGARTLLLLKMLLLKLSPGRRLLLFCGLILLLFFKTLNLTLPYINIPIDNDVLYFVGLFLVLSVLMLELKDKLLAHNELAEGRSVQKELLPETSPQVPGWDIWLFNRPANDVGGDLIDFRVIYENRFSVVLGDVSGKGLSAALLMAKLQTIVRAVAYHNDSMERIGSMANKMFYRDSPTRAFATLAYLEFSPASGSLRIMNAGHLPPVAVCDNNIKKMGKGSIGLGISADAKYKEQTIELKEDEFLLVYSDGLTEAADEKETFFGDKRLEDFLPGLSGLPAKIVGTRIVEKLDCFIGNARAFDDLSLIVLRRKSI
ncbi:MAG: serine/threonine-protein phosphatase [bacterium]|nr:serine/threonine-protein phosphatase [bacterium]